MTMTLKEFTHARVRTDLPDIRPGHVVKVYQKIIETKISGKKQETKERIQVFEGLVIGRKGGKGINANIIVRKISDGIGVERTFPLNAPTIEKIELVKMTKARRAKLNYMRGRVGKATRPAGELAREEKSRQASDKLPEVKEIEVKTKENDSGSISKEKMTEYKKEIDKKAE